MQEFKLIFTRIRYLFEILLICLLVYSKNEFEKEFVTFKSVLLETIKNLTLQIEQLKLEAANSSREQELIQQRLIAENEELKRQVEKQAVNAQNVIDVMEIKKTLFNLISDNQSFIIYAGIGILSIVAICLTFQLLSASSTVINHSSDQVQKSIDNLTDFSLSKAKEFDFMLNKNIGEIQYKDSYGSIFKFEKIILNGESLVNVTVTTQNGNIREMLDIGSILDNTYKKALEVVPYHQELLKNSRKFIEENDIDF